MERNDPIELHMDQRDSFPLDQTFSGETLTNCRNHLESLQNLRYLILLEAEYPQQIKLHLRMMEWHLNNLREVLFQDHP